MQIRTWMILWLVVTFLITFNLPAPRAQSKAFSDAANDYRRQPSVENLVRMRVEQRNVEDHRAWLLLARWMTLFCFGAIGGGAAKVIKSTKRRLRTRESFASSDHQIC